MIHVERIKPYDHFHWRGSIYPLANLHDLYDGLPETGLEM